MEYAPIYHVFSSRKTYKVFFISFQKMLTVGDGALVDEALPSTNQVDTGILQEIRARQQASQSEGRRNAQPEKQL